MLLIKNNVCISPRLYGLLKQCLKINKLREMDKKKRWQDTYRELPDDMKQRFQKLLDSEFNLKSIHKLGSWFYLARNVSGFGEIAREELNNAFEQAGFTKWNSELPIYNDPSFSIAIE